MPMPFAVKMPSESSVKPVFGKRAVGKGRKFEAASDEAPVPKSIGKKKRKAKKFVAKIKIKAGK